MIALTNQTAPPPASIPPAMQESINRASPPTIVDQNFANTHDMNNPAFANYTVNNPVSTTSDATRTGIANTGTAIKDGLNTSVGNTLLSGFDSSALTGDYNTVQKNISDRQAQLAAERDAAINGINSSFDAQKTDLTKTQANETGGESASLARMGGYLGDSASGNGAMISLQNTHIQQIQGLEAKRQAALLGAQQAYNDNNYKLADQLVQESKQYHSEMLNAQKQYADQTVQLATEQRTKQTADLAKTKQETDMQNAARDFAVLHGITKPAYLVGNTAVNTATGERLSLQQFQQLTGQQVGLPEEQTDFSQLEKNIEPTGKYTATTDQFGRPITFNTLTGKYEDGSGNSVDASTAPTVPNAQGVTYEQYGLLANTNFNPKDQMDMSANTYLDRYLKSGTEPSARTLGLGTKANMAAIAQRANDLYFAATGQPLPTPEIIKSNQQLIAANNKLANNLKIQEQTVTQNVDFSLQNLKSNNLNVTGFKPLDGFINMVNDLFNDPATGQLIAQNTTIQNELGSLLAVKNASGTTVYDKLSSAGIISKNDNEAQIRAKVTSLLKEATNFADSLNSANSDLYKQIDPLEQSPNNPNRTQHLGPQTLEDYVKANPNSVDQIDKLHTQFPDYSDKDILDILNGKPSSLNSGGSVPHNATKTSYLGGAKPTPVALATATKYPAGTIGPGQGALQGQCAVFVEHIVNLPTPNNTMGNSKSEKFATVDKYGIPASQWTPKVGDVIVTNENAKYGHTAVVNAVLPNGQIQLSESNYESSKTISHDRTISAKSPHIYGALRGTLKINPALT